MSSKIAKKTAAKSTNLYPSKAASKKDVLKKSASKKKHVVSSSESSSESSDDSSSEEEPPKKSKKSTTKKSKKPVVTSSSESDEEDDEIVVENIPKKEPIVANDGVAILGEGLAAVAQQLAVSNANQIKVLELLAGLFAKMEAKEREVEADVDLLAVVDDAVKRGESVVIGRGDDNGHIHYFESFGHLRENSGKLASKENFVKEVFIEEEEDDNEDAIAALGA